MLTAPHAFTGAAIGVATGNPILGFVGGVVSHYLLDAIPHTDPGTWHYDEPFPHRVHAGDMALGVLDLTATFYGLLLIAGQSPVIAAAPIAGMVGAILPDVIGIAPLFWNQLATVPWLKRYYDFTKQYHRTAAPHQLFFGVFTQALVLLVAVWYLLGS